jgi:uncharacterized membrane protein YdjX (TVP38/TMEM64 family)
MSRRVRSGSHLSENQADLPIVMLVTKKTRFAHSTLAFGNSELHMTAPVMKSKNSMVRLVVLVLLILLGLSVPMLVFGDRFETMFDGERALGFVRAQGSWGAVVAIGMIMADLFIPLPSPAIMAALGLIYGTAIGGLLASIGSFAAASLGYALCRLIGPPAAAWIAGPAQLERLSGFFGRYGIWAIALSRWMPAVPEVLACLAGLTRMRMARFATGNFIGSVPVGFAYAYVGASGADDPRGALAIAFLVPYLALPLFFIYLARSRQRRD